jgi:hypothetical protein
MSITIDYSLISFKLDRASQNQTQACVYVCIQIRSARIDLYSLVEKWASRHPI